MKELLQRKLGPLPVWLWALIIVGGAFFFIRRSGAGTDQQGGADTTTNPTTGVQGSNLGDPMTLSPGESVYDPNTGLLTGTSPHQYAPQELAPGESVFNPATGTTTPPNPSLAPVPLRPGETVFDPNTGGIFTAPGAGAAAKAAKPKLPAGWKRLPFGHNKPHAPKGYTTVGMGHGYWGAKPVRKNTGHHQPAAHKARARSGGRVHH